MQAPSCLRQGSGMSYISLKSGVHCLCLRWGRLVRGVSTVHVPVSPSRPGSAGVQVCRHLCRRQSVPTTSALRQGSGMSCVSLKLSMWRLPCRWAGGRRCSCAGPASRAR